MVAGVNDGGPADKAGIRNGDVILKFNGQDVKEMRTLPRIVAETEIGKQVPVVLWRDGKDVDVQASVGELPDDVQQASATPDAARRAAAEPLGDDLRPRRPALADHRRAARPVQARRRTRRAWW